MAIQTKNIILTINDIDVPWCYQYYLNLPQILTGANLKIRSPLSEDWEPSFVIYKKGDAEYRWNCLSSGNMGDVIDLVRIMKSKELKRTLSRPEAFRIIQNDFDSHLKGNPTSYKKVKQLVNTPGRVVASEMRRWETKDIDFWGKFGISKKRLEYYNIGPVLNFTMHKIKDGVEHNMVIRNPLCYGYYTGQGELAKLYQPGQKAAKFIKILDYVQGSAQLNFNVPNLLIISSMKDGLSFMELDMGPYEFVAPDSENVCLRKTDIDLYKSKYENIRVLFDIDEPGVNSAAKYKEKFGFENIYLDLEKDLSDSIAIYGQDLVKIKLMQLL